MRIDPTGHDGNVIDKNEEDFLWGLILARGNDQVTRGNAQWAWNFYLTHDKYYNFGTSAAGLNGTATAGSSISLQFQVASDNRGNHGILISVVPLTGGGTPSAGISGVISTTNARSLNSLRGWADNVGSSGTLGDVSGGFEINIGNGYSGTTMSGGAKLSPPYEFHYNRSYTWIPITW